MSKSQSIRVFGVPGAGKTTRLISMLKDLNKKYPMREIIYCSYTTAAVNEVKERVKSDYEDRDLIWFKTLHGICFRLLRTSGKPASNKSRIDHLNKFADHFDMDDLIDNVPYAEATEDQIVKWIHDQLDELILKYPEVSDTDVLEIKLGRMVGLRLVDILIKYKLSWFVYCKQNNIFEFNRLLLDVYRQGLIPDAKVLIVDEFQDINHLQNLIIKQFSSKMDLVINAGDHNQSIYGFRGADPGFLKNVKRDSEINLMNTHRLPSKIVEYTKKILPDDDMVQNMRAISDYEGELQFRHFDDVDFGDLEDFSSVFILARTNSILKEVRSRLMKKGITTRNNKSSNSKANRIIKLIDRIENEESIHSKDLKLFRDEKLRLDKLFIDWNMQQLFYEWMDDVGRDGVRPEIATVLLRKMINTDNLRSRIANLVKNRHDKILVENSLGGKIHDIQLLTIHGSKGKEADLVVLINQASGFEFRDDLDEEEEKRVYYVGVTRARKKLIIAHLNNDRDTWTKFLPVN